MTGGTKTARDLDIADMIRVGNLLVMVTYILHRGDKLVLGLRTLEPIVDTPEKDATVMELIVKKNMPIAIDSVPESWEIFLEKEVFLVQRATNA